MDIVDLDNEVGVEMVEIVLLGDDSLGVQVIAVDSCDDGFVMLVVDVVLNDKRLASGEIVVDLLFEHNIVMNDPS